MKSALPEYAIFAFAALFFGLLYVVLNPPFMAPDEDTHYLRSWQLSQGSVWDMEFDEYGIPGFRVPDTVLKTIVLARGDSHLRPDKRVDVVRNGKLFALLCKSKQYEFMAVPTASLYFPLVHLPQAASMALARYSLFPPIALVYAGRIGNLLAWIGLLAWAMAVTPRYKLIFAALGLMPMNLYLASSLSADAVVTGLGFLLTAYTLNFALIGNRLQTRAKIFYGLLCACVCLCKLAYAPLILIGLCIPAANWGGVAKKAAGMGLIVILSALAVGWWQDSVSGLMHIQHPVLREMGSFQEVMDMKKDFILSHAFEYLSIVFGNLLKDLPALLNQMAGARLGWMDAVMDKTAMVSVWLVLFLALFSTRDKGLGLRDRSIFIASALSCLFLVATAMYLVWTQDLSGPIDGLQGRYLIPVSACLGCALSASLIPLPTDWAKYLIPGLMGFLNLAGIQAIMFRYVY